MNQLIYYQQRVVFIGITGSSPLPRAQIITAVDNHLPNQWQFGMTGGNPAYTATANTRLIHGLIGVLILEILGTIIALRYLLKGWPQGFWQHLLTSPFCCQVCELLNTGHCCRGRFYSSR